MVIAILVVIVAFDWDWQIEVQSKPSSHVHSNTVFRATLKARQAITMLLPGICAEMGMISPATEAVEPVCLPAASHPTFLEETGSAVSTPEMN